MENTTNQTKFIRKQVAEIRKASNNLKFLTGGNCTEEIEHILSATADLDRCIAQLEYLSTL